MGKTKKSLASTIIGVIAAVIWFLYPTILGYFISGIRGIMPGNERDMAMLLDTFEQTVKILSYGAGVLFLLGALLAIKFNAGNTILIIVGVIGLVGSGLLGFIPGILGIIAGSVGKKKRVVYVKEVQE